MEQDKKLGIGEQIRNKTSINEIHISRVPKEIKTWFMDYSQSHFCGDYGLCLKHVIDTFRGMTPVGYYELESEIEGLRLELDTVKSMVTHNQDETSNKKRRTMADGTVIE